MKKPFLLIITAILYLVLTGGMSLAKESGAESIEECRQAVTNNPDDSWAHFNLGNAYGELGVYKEAIESYKQAIRIDPDFALAHYNLGGAYLQSNDRDSAIDQYKILKKLDTERANKLFDRIYK